MKAKTCDKKIWSQYTSRPCGKRAKVERDGKHYCGIHDPAKKEAREEAWHKKWEAEKNAIKERLHAEKVRDHKAACFDDLVAALEWAGGHAYAGGKRFKDVDPIKSALQKAREA